MNPAATADNPLIAFGDFKGYHIADRVGLVTTAPQLLQHSTAMRFDGTLGVYFYWRVGADVLVDGSLGVLNVATTA